MERTISYMYLAIERASDPIQGSVSVGGEGARPFHGWIELAEAIEGARREGAPPPAVGDLCCDGGAKSLGSMPGVKDGPDV